MGYGRLICGTLLGVAAMSTSAHAQETRRLDIAAQARVLHDSNISRSSEAEAALSGVKQSDTIYSPGLTVDIFLPVSRQSLFLSGSGGYNFHQENKRLDSDRFDLRGGVNLQGGPCVGVASGSYYRGQNDLQDVSLLVSENAVETKGLQANVSCARPSGLGVTASVSQAWTSNSNVVRLQSDSETTQGSAGIFYARPALGRLTVFGSLSNTDYPHQNLLGVGNGYEARSVNVSFERRISTRLQGIVHYGYSDVEPSNPLPGSSGKFSGSTYGGNLTYRPSTRLTTNLSFDRAITPSNGLGGLFNVSSVWRLSGSYELGSRILVSLGAEMADTDSEGAVALGAARLTNSQTEAAFGAVRFVQSERISWILDARREQRDTNAPQFDYSRTVVGLTANVAF
jgi:hypothetical protein